MTTNRVLISYEFVQRATTIALPPAIERFSDWFEQPRSSDAQRPRSSSEWGVGMTTLSWRH